MSDYIAELQAAFLRLHGCDATYVETVPVIEEFEGKTIWQGDVEVFDIRGHPKATRGYGWGHVAGEKDQADAILPCCRRFTASGSQSGNYVGD